MKNRSMKRKRLSLTLSPSDVFSALVQEKDYAVLLESAEGPGKFARFSFIGFHPSRHIVVKGGVVYENDTPTAHSLSELFASRTSSSSHPFEGGAIGYFSFDYFRMLEDVPLRSHPLFPHAEFCIFDDILVFDHLKHTVTYLFRSTDNHAELLRILRAFDFASRPIRVIRAHTNMDRSSYCKAVAQAHEHIKAGDIFQVILSRKYEVTYRGDLTAFYKRLKTINPSPYLYYLKFGDRHIVGASPENLVRVTKDTILSYATLAGTRPRGKTPREDARLSRELQRDEKERAEHAMLVDLTRNDVGRVSCPGTVRVDKCMHVLKFSHVQHLASVIRAKKLPSRTSLDVFHALFPAGTVSGAPKIRATEIIASLERDPRGPYAGAVGYFSENGNADFAIGIRTLFAYRDTATIQAGAGIVYDSIPEREFDETEAKLGALLHALGGEVT